MAFEYGVLLYYKFTHVPDLNHLLDFYDTNCNFLCLFGRVRLSSNGVNVTVGGELLALKKHIQAVKSNSLFEGTDFKLASCCQPLNDKIAKECGFTSLSIRIVQELVTFQPHNSLKSSEILNAGLHLSASEFHSVLQSSEKGSQGYKLLDVRNLYETRIGKFNCPSVDTLDPRIRQYSDLSSWIDENYEQLHGRCVLMYCTGGIRCEMASAYIKSKGANFENIFQLSGGIQRYLEQYPDGGFFSGKNFVFDHRISVGSSDMRVIGACLLCHTPYDDYSSRCRCTFCRMLVLVCDTCQKKKAVQYVCELCQKQGKGLESVPFTDSSRTSLAKDIAQCQNHNMPTHAELDCKFMPDNTKPSPKLSSQLAPSPPRILRILCLHGFRQNASSFKGRTASLAKKLKGIADLVFMDAPHELPFILHPNNSKPSLHSTPPPFHCRKKRAWFVAHDETKKSETDWEITPIPLDPLQYQNQTDGINASLAYLKSRFSEIGAFDGILGFSQGAAMAALVCAENKSSIGFAILCSGFTRNLDEIEGTIRCPSLHIFGNDLGNKDRQISNEASRKLASFFDDSCSVIIEHSVGHMIPTRAPYIDEIKDFLRRFL